MNIKIVYLIILLISISSLTISNIYAQDVEVSTETELLSAIGPNKTIKIKSGDYYLDSVNFNIINNPNIKYDSKYDGIIISNVDNLKFIAETDTELLINNPDTPILNFNNCKNIEITNAIIGHDDGANQCMGVVLNFDNCKNITINNTELFGSGIAGFYLSNVEDFRFIKSKIVDCSDYLMWLSSCTNINFIDSEFSNSGKYDLINISSSNNILFENCNIISNYSDDYMFKIDNSYGINLRSCIIKENDVRLFSNDDSNININNCTIDQEQFYKVKGDDTEGDDDSYKDDDGDESDDKGDDNDDNEE